MNPSKEQALQFAIMLKAGLPAGEAILYFTSSDDPHEIASMLAKWTKSKEVAAAIERLNGKKWQDMTLQEQIHVALDQHYAGLAYFLFSRNYTDLQSHDKSKADTARQALEAKLAGTAGKLDALSQFAEDLRLGRVKLQSTVPTSKAIN